MSSAEALPSREERIRARAHEIWLHEGCPDGRDLEHWRQAEAEIGAEGSPSVKQQRSPRRSSGAKTQRTTDAKTNSSPAPATDKAKKAADKKNTTAAPVKGAGSRSRGGTKAAAE